MLPKSKRGGEGFTLIELLVVIAIIGLLSTLAIVALGTARQKSRDARRLADIRQIQTALEMYNSDQNTYPVASNILLGDSTHACLGSNGFQATGACTSPFITLPRDPSGGYYTYSGTVTYYTIGATLEGTVGDLYGIVTASANNGTNSYCPHSITYSGLSYRTGLYGSQCWFQQNLNVGIMLGSASTLPSQSGQIEKWCYNNATSSCDNLGGFYTWAEANQLASNCDSVSGCTVPTNNQGICPSGWHIPTDQEFKTLEMYLGMSQAQADLTTTWRGTPVYSVNQGTMMKVGGSSGLEGILTGERQAGSVYGELDLFTDYHTATEYSADRSWLRALGSAFDGVYRGHDMKLNGFPIRCLKNPIN